MAGACDLREVRSRGGGSAEAGDRKRSVEVLAHLDNYPISNGPGVDPVNGADAVAALSEDDGTERGDGVREELEVVNGVSSAGEESHQKLVGRRTMKPPLQIGGNDSVNRVHVTGA